MITNNMRRAHWRAHIQGRGVMRGEFVYSVWTAISIVIFQHSFHYIQSHYHWIIAKINVLQSKKCLYNICILDQIIQIFRITLSLSHCCWYFPTWSPKQFPVIWWSWIALGKTMNGNEWLERERGGWMNTNHHVANLPGRTHTIPTQYHCRTNLGCYTTILFHECTGLFTKIRKPASKSDWMKWCRMSVDHNVKPLQSTTLHQSWDPSLTRLIHTGQTRLLGYMDDQGRRGGGGYFWCLFWFSLAPH